MVRRRDTRDDELGVDNTSSTPETLMLGEANATRSLARRPSVLKTFESSSRDLQTSLLRVPTL